MSWSDLFYPNNPRRRKQVLQLYTKIQTLMEANFVGTNDLIDCLNKYLPGKSFAKIKVDYDKTLGDNSRLIIERIEEIQRYIREKQENLKQKLDPELYRKLTNTDISFADMLEHARKVTGASLETVGSLAGLATTLSVLKYSRYITSMTSKFKKFAASTGAGIAVSAIFMGIDMIASAIIGAIERDKLEEAMQELEESCDEFEPASYKYTKCIMRVVLRLEDLEEF